MLAVLFHGLEHLQALGRQAVTLLAEQFGVFDMLHHMLLRPAGWPSHHCYRAIASGLRIVDAYIDNCQRTPGTTMSWRCRPVRLPIVARRTGWRSRSEPN